MNAKTATILLAITGILCVISVVLMAQMK